MKCESRFKDAVYDIELFCKTCGMDVGMDAIRKRKKGRTMLYCCEECAENGRKK